MDAPVALLLTALGDSAALAQRLGDVAMARVWAAHDRVARDLLRDWRGREIDKTDGFLILFSAATDALGYALAYHRALATLEQTLAVSEVATDGLPLRLRARAGLHVGEITVRETPAADVALGAKPLEVDGVSKPLAARVMSTALGGQTLITAAARDALGAVPQRVLSHGHWRVKGLPVPLELFEVGDAGDAGDAGGAGGQSAPFTPPPDGDKVYRVVRQGDLWLPARDLKHSLPAERDAFVGRRSTLLELARRFDDGARLVSVLGIGGCGKTRLATRFGWQWLGDFPGGVWFCDLAPARTVEGIFNAVAQGLGVPLGPDDPRTQLGQAIAGRGRCLVILDNFEQIARHAEETLGTWLTRAGDARFLVTSREVLGVVGEEALALAPLQADDARQLFLRRAASAKRDFHASDDDQVAIGALVKLLDGLPLAIELAAARVRTLTPRALLARMSERFKLLASSGGRLDRQSTLRAAFDWSWDLLQTSDKAALAQLSVFEGGFTLEAAEAVLDLSDMTGAPWTVDVVHSLVDKSFVRPLDGERFDLLMSVQAYAEEHLQTEGRYPGSGPSARLAAQARHGNWFAALGPQRATDNACADIDNLAMACRRAVLAGRASLAADALVGAWAAISLQGPFKAGVDLAEAVSALPDLPQSAAAAVEHVLGRAWEALGRRVAARQHFETALTHARAVADSVVEAAVTIRLGALHAREGNSNLAREELAHALMLARQAHSVELECAALNDLGTVDFEQGLMLEAQNHYERALSLARRSDNKLWLGKLLTNLSNLHASLGRLAEARSLCEEALVIVRQRADRQLEGIVLNSLGMLNHLLGKPDAALAAAQASNALARELAHLRLECTSLETLGLIHAAAGRTERARQCYEGTLAMAVELGNIRAQAQTRAQLGLMQARLGDLAHGQQNISLALALLRSAGDGISLALALCADAESQWLSGRKTAALEARDEVRALLASAGAGAASEPGTALLRLEALLAPATT